MAQGGTHADARGGNLTSERLLKFGVIGFVFVELVRRLVFDGAGQNAFDPLVIPIGVFLSALLIVGPRERSGGRRGTILLAILAVLPTIAQLLSLQFETKALYWALIETTTFLAAAMVASGRVPDPWHWIYRWAPALGVAVGLYGILQYFILFTWDRAWMINAGLKSIGLPEPRQVRVFGTSEAPGPFALILAISLIIAIATAAQANGRHRVRTAACVPVITIALMLTAVRSALLCAAIAVIWLCFKSGNARLAAAFGVVAGIGYYAMTSALAAAPGTDSQVFVTRRYDVGSLAGDGSFQARLEVLQSIAGLMGHPLGQGLSAFEAGTKRTDNGYVDILLTAGPIAFAAMVMLAITVISIALFRKIPATTDGGLALAAVSMCIVLDWLSGNLVGASVGPVSGLLLGSFLHRFGQRVRLNQVAPSRNIQH